MKDEKLVVEDMPTVTEDMLGGPIKPKEDSIPIVADFSGIFTETGVPKSKEGNAPKVMGFDDIFKEVDESTPTPTPPKPPVGPPPVIPPTQPVPPTPPTPPTVPAVPTSTSTEKEKEEKEVKESTEKQEEVKEEKKEVKEEKKEKGEKSKEVKRLSASSEIKEDIDITLEQVENLYEAIFTSNKTGASIEVRNYVYLIVSNHMEIFCNGNNSKMSDEVYNKRLKILLSPYSYLYSEFTKEFKDSLGLPESVSIPSPGTATKDIAEFILELLELFLVGAKKTIELSATLISILLRVLYQTISTTATKYASALKVSYLVPVDDMYEWLESYVDTDIYSSSFWNKLNRCFTSIMNTSIYSESKIVARAIVRMTKYVKIVTLYKVEKKEEPKPEPEVKKEEPPKEEKKEETPPPKKEEKKETPPTDERKEEKKETPPPPPKEEKKETPPPPPKEETPPPKKETPPPKKEVPPTGEKKETPPPPPKEDVPHKTESGKEEKNLPAKVTEVLWNQRLVEVPNYLQTNIVLRSIPKMMGVDFYITRIMCENLTERIVHDFKNTLDVYYNLLKKYEGAPVSKFIVYCHIARTMMFLFSMSKSAKTMKDFDHSVLEQLFEIAKKKGIRKAFFKRFTFHPVRYILEHHDLLAINTLWLELIFKNDAFMKWAKDELKLPYVDTLRRFKNSDYENPIKEAGQEKLPGILKDTLETIVNTIAERLLEPGKSNGYCCFIPLNYVVGTARNCNLFGRLTFDYLSKMSISYRRTLCANAICRHAVKNVALLKLLSYNISKKVKDLYKHDVALMFASIMGIGNTPIIFGRGAKSIGGAGYSDESLYVCHYERTGTGLPLSKKWQSLAVSPITIKVREGKIEDKIDLGKRKDRNKEEPIDEDKIIEGTFVDMPDGSTHIVTESDPLSEESVEKLKEDLEDGSAAKELIDKITGKKEDEESSEETPTGEKSEKSEESEASEDDMYSDAEKDTIEPDDFKTDAFEEGSDASMFDDMSEEERKEFEESENIEEAEANGESKEAVEFTRKKENIFKRFISGMGFDPDSTEPEIDFSNAYSEDDLDKEPDLENSDFKEYADDTGLALMVTGRVISNCPYLYDRYCISKRLTAMGYIRPDRFKIFHIENKVARAILATKSKEEASEWVYNRIMSKGCWQLCYDKDMLALFAYFINTQK